MNLGGEKKVWKIKANKLMWSEPLGFLNSWSVPAFLASAPMREGRAWAPSHGKLFLVSFASNPKELMISSLNDLNTAYASSFISKNSRRVTGCSFSLVSSRLVFHFSAVKLKALLFHIQIFYLLSIFISVCLYSTRAFMAICYWLKSLCELGFWIGTVSLGGVREAETEGRLAALPNPYWGPFPLLSPLPPPRQYIPSMLWLFTQPLPKSQWSMQYPVPSCWGTAVPASTTRNTTERTDHQRLF